MGDENNNGMSHEQFRAHGRSTLDYVADYLENIRERRVVPTVSPGYLKELMPSEAPPTSESFERLLEDFDKLIMPGITHWHHPNFHAYFPVGNSYPAILADVLSDAIGGVGFSWAACPAMTELEVIMLDWLGKMLGLPEQFLNSSGKGGGVIQSSASECTLVSLLAARFDRLNDFEHNNQEKCDLLSRLVAYCSTEAHSSVEKAGIIGMVKLRKISTDGAHSMRGEELRKAIEKDKKAGLIPFFVVATLGTTSCCSFDNLEEIGAVCEENGIWLHVDAAYAGSAFICPEFRHLLKGVEHATSFNMNPHKMLLVNLDCSTMWLRDKSKLIQSLVVDPLYLQHDFMDQSIDYRNWTIPLGRRFRALKLWFVIRTYGISGLQEHIRAHFRLAKKMESLLRCNGNFEIVNEVLMGLVCFRMKGSGSRALLDRLNASGRIHMVPALLNGEFMIRYCVCTGNATDRDVELEYELISNTAKKVLDEQNGALLENLTLQKSQEKRIVRLLELLKLPSQLIE